ncbi:MAG: NAD(P)-binding protein [Alphaproteobacteria bacterium]
MAKLGSEANPLRVAVVGSGPSGFYAAEALLKSEHKAIVDMYERLPAPFGLVRSGVAPDHPKLKQSILVYDKIAQQPGFTFLGNVTIGKDLTPEELRAHYHAVIFTCGAETDRKLGVPGEDLPGSHTATEFVGWYNGHPDYRDRVFDLSCESAVIIGQGNVAADVGRILAKTVDELKTTDIAQHALDCLAQSKIREIHVIGRRGPAQAKFTSKELREFGELADCQPIVDPADLKLNPESQAELADKTNMGSASNFKIFESFAAQPASSKKRRCVFHFLEGPVALEGSARLERVVLAKNRLEGQPFHQSARPTGETAKLDCGILFRSIGYRGVAMPGVPFDDKAGVFRNVGGRITEDGNKPVPGLYVAGWIKRGPSGIIGTNRACAVGTVAALFEDLAKLDSGSRRGAEGVRGLLAERGVRVIGYSDWQKIDAAEINRGQPKGKPREKFTRVAEMISILG